ncbi:hypothetical protein HYPBUDRAFT_6531 [Hyphopichia burtonii NRRL Y-1933]|uniref:Uncharacterized protein n=1 Tax=Hyphopichia burtonii NRRL Y-1933 TaxID=984485 RepID=A0A1E4RIZ9_9ASCO|nr:hypothetical protein HYPBUDRAFT_6531 [Hyphopichia burtonii NRRL Y-1933]ODV67248.1 hypothetical protein HYPBUDRAFT_6531 [Hyphopichia burtonii NRRL Y-1933]
MALKKENVTHIKHSPNNELQSKINQETTFLVKSSTPYISAIKRIKKILEKFDKTTLPNKKYQRGDYKKVKYILVKGMGKAIEKTLSIGLNYKEDLKYKVDIITGTVEVYDEFQPKIDSEDEDEAESSIEKRRVSYVEIRIWLKRDAT